MTDRRQGTDGPPVGGGAGSDDERSIAPRGAATRRGRGAVAASILGALLLGGYLAAAPGEIGALPASYLISAAVLLVAFWFPAMRIGSGRDVVKSWLPLLVWLLAWTLVWDLATSGITGQRELFDEWWIVYPAGVLVLAGLLALHGAVVGRWAEGTGGSPGGGSRSGL